MPDAHPLAKKGLPALALTCVLIEEVSLKQCSMSNLRLWLDVCVCKSCVNRLVGIQLPFDSWTNDFEQMLRMKKNMDSLCMSK